MLRLAIDTVTKVYTTKMSRNDVGQGNIVDNRGGKDQNRTEQQHVAAAAVVAAVRACELQVK